MRMASVAVVLFCGFLQAQQLTPSIQVAPAVPAMGGTPVLAPEMVAGGEVRGSYRGLFQSDHDFPSFIGPITSPVLSKDPRSLTELRGLFINNWFPNSHPVFAGGNAQVYAAQARVALTDRLTFIADKDGIANINAKGIPSQTGFLDVAAGLKYTFLRDVETQTLGAAGFMYEIPSGEAKVFQNHGAGVWTVFGVFGQGFDSDIHVLANVAYQFGQNSRDNSSFFFTQIHVDKGFGGWLYPLAEVNWYQYASGGNRGLPAAVGEGDGLINLGTSGVGGNTLVTAALGLKAKLSRNLEFGAAWETPLTSRKDLLLNRLVAEVILRY